MVLMRGEDVVRFKRRECGEDERRECGVDEGRGCTEV